MHAPQQPVDVLDGPDDSTEDCLRLHQRHRVAADGSPEWSVPFTRYLDDKVCGRHDAQDSPQPHEVPRAERVEQARARLRQEYPECAEVLDLTAQSMSLRAIVDELGISFHAVRTRLARARALLAAWAQ